MNDPFRLEKLLSADAPPRAPLATPTPPWADGTTPSASKYQTNRVRHLKSRPTMQRVAHYLPRRGFSAAQPGVAGNPATPGIRTHAPTKRSSAPVHRHPPAHRDRNRWPVESPSHRRNVTEHQTNATSSGPERSVLTAQGGVGKANAALGRATTMFMLPTLKGSFIAQRKRIVLIRQWVYSRR